MMPSRVTDSRKRTVFTAFIIAFVVMPSLSFAAGTDNMQGMSGMNMATGTAAAGSNVSISDIAKLNAQAELDAAAAMHQSTIGDLTSSETMAMSMGSSSETVSTTTADIVAALSVVGYSFWWAVFILFALLCVGSFYLYFAGAGSIQSRSARIKWPGIIFALLALLSLAATLALSQDSFKVECLGDGNAWGTMQPMVAGEMLSDTPVEGCMWGMGSYVYQFTDQNEYRYYENLPIASVSLTNSPQQLVTGVPTTFTVSLKNADGTPATLFIDMDKVLHIVVVSKDETVYAHIHPDDLYPLTQQEIDSSTFTFDYTFPKSGDYLVMFDYAHGLTLETKQFVVHVTGGPAQAAAPAVYATPATFTLLNTTAPQEPGRYVIAPNFAQALELSQKQSFVEVAESPQEESAAAKVYGASATADTYDASVTYELPIAGKIETIYYSITQNGKPVTFVPWLDAAMHVTVVKNDLSWHLHVHGEVHPPGTPIAPLMVKDGQVVHSMAMMVTPPVFTLPIEAHLIFPSPGTYTVWGQFKTQSGELVTTAFTVQVD